MGAVNCCNNGEVKGWVLLKELIVNCSNVLTNVTMFALLILTNSMFVCVHVGKSMSENPGYLKLRKIRAAQAISQTVCLVSYLTTAHT